MANYPTLTLPATHKNPSFFNEDIWTGIGVAGAITFAVMPLAPIALGAVALGGVIGGMLGRARQQRESEQEHQAKPPTFFNKGLLTGLGKAVVIRQLLVVAALGAISLFDGGFTAASTLLSGGVAGTSVFGGTVAHLLGLAGAGISLVMPFIQAKRTRHAMAETYKEAIEYSREQKLSSEKNVPAQQATMDAPQHSPPSPEQPSRFDTDPKRFETAPERFERPATDWRQQVENQRQNNNTGPQIS